MHAYGNERTSSQRIGRLLRLDPNDTSTCHILCYKNTQDQVWVKNALKDFDSSKIKYYNPLKSWVMREDEYLAEGDPANEPDLLFECEQCSKPIEHDGYCSSSCWMASHR